MLFLVSDDPPAEGAAPGKTPSVKVELDIEDAPFLQEPDEPKPPTKEPERPAPAEAAADILRLTELSTPADRHVALYRREGDPDTTIRLKIPFAPCLEPCTGFATICACMTIRRSTQRRSRPMGNS